MSSLSVPGVALLVLGDDTHCQTTSWGEIIVFWVAAIGQPVENVRDTKDENITDYIDEITESKDAHEMVKITLFPEEPDNGQDVANDTKKSNKNLKSRGLTNYYQTFANTDQS